MLTVQAITVAALAGASNHLLIGALTVIIVIPAPGIVPLVLARVHETVPGNAARQNVIWSRATTVFAASQALSGYAYSAIFNGSGGNHRLLFVMGPSQPHSPFSWTFAFLRCYANRQSPVV